jgi:TRAP-type uncharacterized transport system fused permease subunit
MIGIGVATAAAGIIVATVTKTPIGTELAGLVEQLSGGILILMLVLSAFSLILGMGLPTTANYIVVSSLMASVVVSLGAQEGLIVPLIAAHLFVFYFGIMADVTPPVGLASFAAAAVSGGDPIKTGFTAFFYSLRTVALPFLFIFNPTLILYGVDLGTTAGILQAVFVFVADLRDAAVRGRDAGLFPRPLADLRKRGAAAGGLHAVRAECLARHGAKPVPRRCRRRSSNRPSARAGRG